MNISKPRKRKSPHGAPRRFIDDLLMQPETPECVVWPFNRMGKGYGKLRDGNRVIGAHRLVCELVYGSAPSKHHEAAHSCGNGFGACVNPKHIRWATRQENAADKILHNTNNRGEKHGLSKLTETNVREILRLKGAVPQEKLARRYGVSQSTIRRIYTGETWSWLNT